MRPLALGRHPGISAPSLAHAEEGAMFFWRRKPNEEGRPKAALCVRKAGASCPGKLLHKAGVKGGGYRVLVHVLADEHQLLLAVAVGLVPFLVEGFVRGAFFGLAFGLK